MRRDFTMPEYKSIEKKINSSSEPRSVSLTRHRFEKRFRNDERLKIPVVVVILQNHNNSVPFNGPDKAAETSIIGSYYLFTDKASRSY